MSMHLEIGYKNRSTTRRAKKLLLLLHQFLEQGAHATFRSKEIHLSFSLPNKNVGTSRVVHLKGNFWKVNSKREKHFLAQYNKYTCCQIGRNCHLAYERWVSKLEGLSFQKVLVGMEDGK